MTQIKLCKNGGQVQVAATITTPKGSDLRKIHRVTLSELPACAQDDYAAEVLHGGNTRFSINIANPKSKNEIWRMASALHAGLSAYVPDLVIDATLNVPEEAPA